MPKKILLELKGSAGQRYSSSVATLLHGALMENIDSDYVGRLHSQDFHPFSQYALVDGDTIKWQISVLNEEAEDKIISRLMADDLQEIILEHRNERFEITRKEVIKEVSYHDLINEFYFGKQDRYLRLKFLTTTSFKQNGQYCIFPSVRLIFQNLMKKYDQSSEDSSIFTEELLEHYEKYAQISGYRLQSSAFRLEGIKVPGFRGEITVKINGPQQMVNMAWLLAKYGEYSGVGIKTGIGMGGMEIAERQDKNVRQQGVEHE